MPNGKYPQDTVDLLEYIGRWLKINGEAIYATRRWEVKYQEKDGIYYTRSKDKKTIYVIHIGWPYQKIDLTDVTPVSGSEITMFGIKEELPWNVNEGVLTIVIPKELNDKIPCEYAYALKITIA